MNHDGAAGGSPSAQNAPGTAPQQEGRSGVSTQFGQLPEEGGQSISRHSLRSPENARKVSRIQSRDSFEANNLRLEPTINAGVCRKYPIDKQGRFSDRTMVVEGLRKLRPDLSKVALEKVVIA